MSAPMQLQNEVKGTHSFFLPFALQHWALGRVKKQSMLEIFFYNKSDTAQNMTWSQTLGQCSLKMKAEALIHFYHCSVGHSEKAKQDDDRHLHYL